MSNETPNLILREIPPELRPRERLSKYGVETLDSRDLLALLLGTGTKSLSALGLADRLLTRFNSLSGVLLASVEELMAVRGVGIAKAAQIKAAFESGRRLQQPRDKKRPVRTAAEVVEYVLPKMRLLDHEEVWLLLMDVKLRVIGVHVVAVGHLSGAPVHPRELYKEAVRRSSFSVIMVHNHPSGDPTPSTEDILLTERLREAGMILGIELVDHIIVGDDKFVSLKDEGYW